ncbi:MAG: NAD(P)/FAD-dependent oxidoreductase [Bullifex sp.]
MHYVIIGNSYAALGAITGIRKNDKTSPITVISKEEYPSYARPVISYVLMGKAKEENLPLRSDGFWSENSVKVMLGCEAVKIDSEAHTVTLASGETLNYDRLLLATGSVPFIPPMKGLENVEKKFTFMTWADMKAVEKACTKKTDVLIMGAGLIGLKAAEGLLDRVKSVTVVDLADRVLPSILDKEGSEIVQRELEKKGIDFHLGTSAEEFKAGSVLLKNGKEVSFDVLILAVGVRPSVKLASDAGAATGRGIKVDDMCRTTLPDVYAAGDVAEEKEFTTGEDRIIAIIPNATLQGECAGANMAGAEKHFENPVAMNAIGFFGTHIITAGTYTGDAEVFKERDSYKKFFIRDDRLMGFILMGKAVDRAGIYTSLVRGAVPLSSIDWETLKAKPLLAAFALRERKKMLSKEV